MGGAGKSAVKDVRCTIRMLGMVVFAAAGCGSNGGGPSDASANDAPALPLASCVVGVWLGGKGPCAGSGTPEATQADCVESPALVLATDGTSIDATLTISATASTFSALGGVGGVLDGTWVLQDVDSGAPQLLQTYSTSTTLQTGIACTASQLTRPPDAQKGYLGITYTRADAQLTAGVLAAKSTTWTAITY